MSESNSFLKKFKYVLPLSVVEKKYGPIMCLSIIPAHTLTEKFNWNDVSRVFRGFSTLQKCWLCELKMPVRLNVD